MKNIYRTTLMIALLLIGACEKEETLYETENKPQAISLNAEIASCDFEPTVVTTITGNGPGYQDGPISTAKYFYPTAVAIDAQRNAIYIADWQNNCIRIIKNNKTKTFVGGVAGDKEGWGTKAQLNTPSGIVLDKQGNLFVVDKYNHKIRKVTPEGKMTTFAGGNDQGYANGRGTNAKFNSPYGITIDDEGVLYVTDEGNMKIRYIKSDGSVGTIAGSSQGLRDSNRGSTAQFRYPRGIDIGPDGALYVADTFNHRIRRVDIRTGRTSTFAGSRFGNSNGHRLRANLAYPTDVVCDKAGNFFVSDTFNHRIQVVHEDQLFTIAGGRLAGNLDGDYDQSRFRYPKGLTIFNDDLFVVDGFNHSLRKIDLQYDCN